MEKGLENFLNRKLTTDFARQPKISIALLVAIPLMFFLPSRLGKASID